MSSDLHTGFDEQEYPHINKGLDGIVAFSTTKSFIDGKVGDLIYSGYHIDTLAENATFEEVCFLLWNDRLPNSSELNHLKKELIDHRELPETVLTYIKSTSKDAEPMAVLRTAVSMLADSDSTFGKYDESLFMDQAISITARIPSIIAAFDRSRKGKDIISPLKEGSTAFNFLYMLNGEKPGEQAEKTMDLCLILHAEHGMNASTFTARTITATMSDMYSSVTGAIGALKGPLHGGANEAVMKMINEIKTLENTQSYILDKLKKKDRIMGFGHRVYKTIDPRAVILSNISKQLQSDQGGILYDISTEIENIMKREKNLRPNVDFYAASVYTMLNIPSHLFTPIFAVSRISGWCAQILEQYVDNRLIRPRANYVGPKSRTYIPLKDR